MNRKKKLPQFKSTEEEAEFWKTHSTADFQDELEPVEMTVKPGPEGLSPRCPLDNQIMLSRYIDLHLGNGRVTLEGLEELYCPKGDYARLAPEAEQLVQAIQETLKRIRRKTEKLAA